MSIDNAPSPEEILATRIKSVLTAHYDKVIAEGDPEYEGSVLFVDFDTPSQVEAVLKAQDVEYDRHNG